MRRRAFGTPRWWKVRDHVWDTWLWHAFLVNTAARDRWLRTMDFSYTLHPHR